MSDDKPFACKVPGCNQKFTNEDHLEVHRKKHDASLGIINLKSLDTPVIADQTPTPTRFLKNLAGDDGLISDPNPFDAMFIRASKLDDSGAEVAVATPDPVPVNIITANDAPSTQPISIVTTDATESVPSLESNDGSIDSQIGSDVLMDDDLKVEEVVVESTSTEPRTVADIGRTGSLQELTNAVTTSQGSTTIVVMSQPAQAVSSSSNQAIQLSSNQLASLSGVPVNGPLMIKLPSGQTIPILPPSVTNPQMPIPAAISANPSKEQDGAKANNAAKGSQNSAVKMKLKTTLLSNQTQGNMNVMAQAVDVVTRQQEVVHTTNSEENPLKRQSTGNEDDPEDKRKKFLERNRAAAMRCRNKRKQWITDLEKRADELTNNNVTLNNEVTKLRNEVAQLKELLLAHKDCPVTLQQRAAGMFMRIGELPSKEEKPAGIITINTSAINTSNPS